MSRLTSFLDQQQADGIVDSQGAFTIDLSRAFTKLAKFQLQDPSISIVRFAQAANLAAESFAWDARIAVGSKMAKYRYTATFCGWDPEYTLEKIADSVVNPDFSGTNGALDYLRIGLITNFHLSSDGIEFTHRIKGEDGAHRLHLSDTLQSDFEKSETANQENILEIKWVSDTKLLNATGSPNESPTYLDQSSLLSRIPINSLRNFREAEKKTETNTKTKPKADLHWHYFGTADGKLPTVIEEHSETERYTLSKTIVPTGSRTGLLIINTDQRQSMELYFVKAGMVVTKIQKESKIKGVTAYIDVDDLKTDLTGSQFLESGELDKIQSWVEESSKLLIEPAICTAKKLLEKNCSRNPNVEAVLGVLEFYLMISLMGLFVERDLSFLKESFVPFAVFFFLVMLFFNRQFRLEIKETKKFYDTLIAELKSHQDSEEN